MTGRAAIYGILFLGYAVLAEAGDIRRPQGYDGGPTEVRVTIVILAIDKINSADQNFTANLFVAARWTDPRLPQAAHVTGTRQGNGWTEPHQGG